MPTTDPTSTTLDSSQVERLVAFVYLLTRGIPSFDGVPWGAVKGLVRELAEIEGEPSFCSPAGEALAREIVQELLTGARPARQLIDQFDELHETLVTSGLYLVEDSDPLPAGILRRWHFDTPTVATFYTGGVVDVVGPAVGTHTDLIRATLRKFGWEVKAP